MEASPGRTTPTGSASLGSPTTRGSRPSGVGTSRSGSSGHAGRGLRTDGEGATHRGALPAGGPHRQGAPQGAQPVGHSLQPAAVGRGRGIEPRPVIGDLEGEVAVLAGEPNGC